MYVFAPFVCSTLWIQKMASDALELEIFTIWVLIMEPECFGKIASDCTCWLISTVFFFKNLITGKAKIVKLSFFKKEQQYLLFQKLEFRT